VIVAAGKLESLLGASGGDGLTTSSLAAETGGDADQIRTLLRELEDAGRVRRSGQRRGTRWHPVTDDDLVAQRAAQLAAQSRKAKAGQAATPEVAAV
jgi:DNA-binding GntR family transcriptional regulator